MTEIANFRAEIRADFAAMASDIRRHMVLAMAVQTIVIVTLIVGLLKWMP